MSRAWTDTPRALYITTDQPDICTLYRVFWPSLELSARGHVADYCGYGDLNLYEPALHYGRYTTLITPRMAFAEENAEQEWLTLRASLPNQQWWYDCDDDLWSPVVVDRLMDTHLWPEPTTARYGMEVLRQSRIRLLDKVDGVTVTNSRLANVASRYTNAPIVIVPNGINVRPYVQAMSEPLTRLTDHVTVGWSGGPRLEADLEPLYEVWPKLAKLRPDVHFVLQGWLPPKMVRLISAERLHCVSGIPNDRYPAFLRNIDIFCCVSSDDPWNLAKTPIKWFEATLAGCACVVSDNLYGQAIKPATAGFVASSVDEWLEALLLLVDDAELRRTTHIAALETVLCKHTLIQTAPDWLNAWSGAAVAT